MEDDIPDDCLQAMESLLENFGSTGLFALEVAFQKEEWRRRRTKGGADQGPSLEAITKFKVHSEMSLASLAFLYARNMKGCIDEFSVHSLDNGAIEEAMFFTFCHYNKLRLARLQQNTKGGIEDKNQGRWKQLSLRGFNDCEFYSRVLDHPSMDIFTEISIGIPISGSPNRLDSETMPSLRKLFNRGRHDSLKIFKTLISPEDATHLGEIVGSNCLREIEFSNVEFVSAASTESILNGFHRLEALPCKEENVFSRLRNAAINFAWNSNDSVATVLLRCLGRLQSLEEVELVVNFTAPIAKALIQELLSRSSCRIQKIKIHWRFHSFSWGALSQESTLLKEVCRALASNANIRDVEMTFNGGANSEIISSVFQGLSSSDCNLRRFSFTNPAILDRREDLATPLANAIVVLGETDEAPLSDNDDFCSSRQVWYVDFGNMYWRADFLYMREWERYIQDIQVVLRFVSKEFPYVYRLSEEAKDVSKNIRYVYPLSEEAMNSSKLFPFGYPLRTSTKFNPPIQQDLRMIGVWLERNQVCRALLLPSVASKVPVALWSLVLEKAANSPSSLCREKEQNNPSGRRAPWNGIFYVIQKLAENGGTATTEAAQLPNATTTSR